MATVTTLEGTVENGQIQLPRGVRLPERAKVYVVIPEAEPTATARIMSPRLANRDQAKDFVMQVEDAPVA